MTSGRFIPPQIKPNSSYQVLGGMAGSSMDGLDLALVRLDYQANGWQMDVMKCETIEYPSEVLTQLQRVPIMSHSELKVVDQHFGQWIGKKVKEFLKNHPETSLTAMHGHTALHRPAEKISWQLGDGQLIANLTGIATVTNFRNADISIGGQGAPLVPFGDFELFNSYDACLNLGGIANVSIKASQTAWDITPCNQVLNHYARQLGKAYDNHGHIARNGTFISSLFEKVAKLPFFYQQPPKSLANQYISPQLLDEYPPEDGLRTMTEFIAHQIAKDIHHSSISGQLLATGGGAYNDFLIELLQDRLLEIHVTVPSDTLVSFKESTIFAFLGLMTQLGQINTYASVTGASRDSCGGVIHLPE